jgi:hypothetical protein
MNALAPPKQKRAPAKSALPKLRLLPMYRVAAVLATTFGWPFWLSEQWRGRLKIESTTKGAAGNEKIML